MGGSEDSQAEGRLRARETSAMLGMTARAETGISVRRDADLLAKGRRRTRLDSVALAFDLGQEDWHPVSAYSVSFPLRALSAKGRNALVAVKRVFDITSDVDSGHDCGLFCRCHSLVSSHVRPQRARTDRNRVRNGEVCGECVGEKIGAD